MIIKGGPPAPVRWCANCDTELMARPLHCKNDRDELFCDPICRSELRIMREAARVTAMSALYATVWHGS